VKINKPFKDMKIGKYTCGKEFILIPNSWNLPLLMLLSLLFAQILFIAPAQAQLLNKRLTINIASTSINDGLKQLSNKANCQINYDRSIFNASHKVQLQADNLTLSQALTKMLNGSNVGFKEVGGNSIVLYPLPVPQKPGRISGKIVDSKGVPLSGASVKILGTKQSMQSGNDGGYSLTVDPGTYNVEVSFISYQSQRVTGVVVKAGESTALTLALKESENTLEQVVVTSNFKKASISGLLAQQKNAAGMTNGISAEQIGATPDKHIGESLKRISGVSTIDNKFVLVRGIGERYNSATLDGTLLPSTEAQNRTFSFDMIPSNIVDNVIVNKTITPDMNASFGGGLIQINTKDVPTENFMSFTAGVSYNDQSTGKQFLSHKRGKTDYLGFDDGGRDFPKDLFPVFGLDYKEKENFDKITEQSKRFKNDPFTVYQNTTAPSQNYQFTIGRLFSLGKSENGTDKFGFTGSISYRNTQGIQNIEEMARGEWLNKIAYGDTVLINSGKAYGYNTTWGGILNMGIQLKNHRFSFRNTYTRIFDNTLVRIIGREDNNPVYDHNGIALLNQIQEVDDPTFTGLLQNKVTGQHQLNKLRLEWDVARTNVNRKEKDMGITQKGLRKIGDEYQFFQVYSTMHEPKIKPISRQNYANSENNYSWNVSGTMPFDYLRTNLKLGYFGLSKNAKFDWQIVSFAALPISQSADSLSYMPVSEVIKPENMGEKGYQFMPWYTDYFEGKSRIHAGYAMLDNRLGEKWRLVWGVRAENYEYTEIRNPLNGKMGEFGNVYIRKEDKRKLEWLPSANLTFTPISSLNIRAAFSSTMIRPEMMENSQFFKYSAYLGGSYGSNGLFSTRINSWDFKTEWFPGLGEILSAGVFYKHFDKPAELTYRKSPGGAQSYILNSANWAKVYGLEFELRKSLSFINENELFKKIALYGNLTLQKSQVNATYTVRDENDPEHTKFIEVSMLQNRSMYGQSPYMFNLGVQYNGDKLGLNLSYNKIGLTTVLASNNPMDTEYEQPKEFLDAQISYRFLNKRMQVKFNGSNLLNTASIIYRNEGSYMLNPDYKFNLDISNAFILKEGFTTKFEEGDNIVFKKRLGRTFSTSLTYNF